MRVSALFGSFLVLAFSSVASGAPRALKLRQRIAPPRNWVDLGRASPTHVIPLRIALPQSRFTELEQHLAEISDPFHARYGEYLSKEDVEELVAPHASSVDAVHEWLDSHGVPKEACHQSPAGDWVSVRLPVAQAEKMLRTVGLCVFFAPKTQLRARHRSFTCGSMLRTGMSSCVRQSTACLHTSISTLSSSSRRPHSIVLKGSTPRSASLLFSTLPILPPRATRSTCQGQE